MKRFIPILAASLAAFLLWGCTPREVVVSRPVKLDLKIEKVTGTKVVFSVTSSNENACYAHFTLSEGHPAFDRPEKEVAREYLDVVADMWEGGQKENTDFYEPEEGVKMRFSDFALFRGSRKLKQIFLSSNTDFKLILVQVNPRTHQIIGEPLSERFHTKAVPMKPLEFNFTVEDHTLRSTPSDPEQTYFWAVDRLERIEDNYSDAYTYMYSLIDMYEDYGFVERILSKGTVTVDFDRDQLWDDYPYVASAFGYSDGEICSAESDWFFVSSDGYLREAQF